MGHSPLVGPRVLILLSLVASGAVRTEAQTTLIVNGDAETVTTTTASSTTVIGTTSTTSPVPGWTAPTDPLISTGIVDLYTNGYPQAPAPGPNDRGLRIFAGGISTLAELHQTIDLTGQAGMPFTLCGFLGGFASQNDNATLTAKFKDAGALPTGTDATIGPVLAADRNFTSGLCLRSTSGTVPIGATQVEVVLTFNNLTAGGPFNDGYADNLHFVLAASCPETDSSFPCTTTTTTAPPTTTTSSTSTTTSTSTSTSTTTSTSAPTSTTFSTTSTPTTSSTTTQPSPTTTTLPVACATDATFDAIDCRLIALEADVATAPALGNLQDKLRKQVTDAKKRFEQIPRNPRQAKALVKVAGRKLTAFSRRLNSKAGRKVITSTQTRSRLTSQADAIRADMLTYRRTI